MAESLTSSSSSSSILSNTNSNLSSRDLESIPCGEQSTGTNQAVTHFIPNPRVPNIYSQKNQPAVSASGVSIYKGRNQEVSRHTSTPPVVSAQTSSIPAPTSIQRTSRPIIVPTFIDNPQPNVTIHSEEEEPPEDIAPDPRDFYSQFYREDDRLKTYYDWPANAAVTKQELAKNGFIYQHTADRVQCVFCRACLSNWERGDVVENEHRKHCPECPFAFGYDTRNVPIVRRSTQNENRRPGGTGSHVQRHVAESISRPSDRTQPITYNTTVKVPVTTDDVARLANRFDSHRIRESPTPAGAFAFSGPQSRPVDQSVANSPSSLLGSGGVITEPKYREWENESTRLMSFRGWPAQMSQIPRQLVDAGLLYMGEGDRCKCYWCGGELYDWEPEDNPWVEHAKWFPQCGYVHNKKGVAFINTIRGEQTGEVVSGNDNLLQNPHVLAVLHQGYTPEQVEEVYRRHGENVLVNALKLIEAIKRTRYEREQALQNTNRQDNNSIISSSSSLPEPSVMMSESHGVVAQASEDVEMGEIEENPPSSENRMLHNRSLNSIVRPESSCSSGSLELESVLEENKKLKDQQLCKICMDKEVCITFLPCGHLATCLDCSTSLHECPMCRRKIEDKVRTYWS
ncbi:putative inhibitor of apoptosis [Mya arenaria]|uniref:putative inhibitor of apoptosis n=1 Tax=Mya arenaria TaxID=6604 RepID=UPI0022E8608C|nr:putative inhibitor of apoptosis [Mya arenaria]XP_052808114.1 putative inhibitor of apoptosis [Mya arenaria]